MTNSSPTFNLSEQKTLFGHPTGLYTLFFAEMWERFSYYGMRALLMLYMIKGFLGYGDKDANAVYGAYTALVYLTPFFGGMIADRWLGSRVSVIIGGILMAAGHLIMTAETDFWFFTALGFIIIGNGFFKPNISTIVGNLYPDGSPKRDRGFTIFYIGINLGAAMAPLLCGYIGEVYGWEYGFGLATIGMLIGVTVFMAPTGYIKSLMMLIILSSIYYIFIRHSETSWHYYIFFICAGGALLSAIYLSPNIYIQLLLSVAALFGTYGLLRYNSGDFFSLGLNIFVSVVLIIAGISAVLALSKGGLPKEVGGIPDPQNFNKYLRNTLIGIPFALIVFITLVSGFAIIPGVDSGVILIPESIIEPLANSDSAFTRVTGTIIAEMSRPAGLVLFVVGLGCLIALFIQSVKLDKIAREKMYVVFVLMFFVLLFWAFFEQSGSSVNNFTDRNIDRVSENRLVTDNDVGKTQKFRLVAANSNELVKDLEPLSQEFLGQINDADMSHLIKKAITHIEMSKPEYKRMTQNKLSETINVILNETRLTMSTLTYLREYAKSKDAQTEDTFVEWTFHKDSVGTLGLGGTEIPASVFQSVNPVYIIIFGLVFTLLWSSLSKLGLEPNTPVKFALGLIQLGFGFAMLYFGAQSADSTGMVAAVWLLLMYLLLTTGELCLSPVGLSMVTKLSPKHLVSTTMGAWFVATAFSQIFSAIIAQFAAVNEGDSTLIPIPSETVHIYGDVYQLIAYMAVASGILCLLLSPILKKWMHEEEETTS